MLIYFFKVIIYSLFFCLYGYCENDSLKVLKDSHENFLFVATIDGNIHLVNRYTGELKWSTKLTPFIKTTSANKSMLIPNPINGQLYVFHSHQNGDNVDVFSPLEHSLMEYIKKTPLFLDNFLLTGSKSDQWLSIDIETGKILHRYQTGSIDNCPQSNQNTEGNHTMFIGICRYNLVVSEPATRQIIYNVVLNSLATHAVTDLDEYDMRHYASSDSGLIVTKYKANDIETGWSFILDSSVIGLYSVTAQGILSRLQFTSMAHDTLSYLFLGNGPWNFNKVALKKAMFFGQTNSSWYVLKTFIHQNDKVKFSTRQLLPLITGPVNGSIKYQYFNNSDNSLIEGFYEVPVDKFYNHQNRLVITNYLLDFDKNQLNTALISKHINHSSRSQSSRFIEINLQFHILSLLICAIFVTVIYIACFITKKNSSENKLKDSRSYAFSQLTYDMDNKYHENEPIFISDLCYFSKDILGYGTNGTVVFRGVFLGNDRPVAVKRLLKSERSHYELQFLRQSFDCSHLIKCFYITETREFTFLALELCECTLEDYVSNATFRENCGLDKLTACKQMILGVHFLHDKGIVHRDLKPRNVLVMKQNKVRLQKATNVNNISTDTFQYKIVISDFGLSRQSQDYGISITKTGGGGTSGYMAPELSMDEVKRITTNSDIFSCGILIYFIFTNGHHPFGNEIVSRQHRIHQGNFLLDTNLIQDMMLLYFISLMLRSSPNERPTADEILHGPLFWEPIEKLSFLCDVSDYMEKNDFSLQISLDKKTNQVFSDKWTDVLDSELVDTLTTQRSYKTKNLSHLTRALRNKRNHFHELPATLSKRLFNGTVSGLAAYINQQFPNLYTTLYDWVRSHLEMFPNSIHHYFPSLLISKSVDFCSSSGNVSEDVTEPAINNDYLEWRRSKRKRPNQPKKCRGSKIDKKSIQ